MFIFAADLNLMMNLDKTSNILQDTIFRQDTVFFADTIKIVSTDDLTGDSSALSDTLIVRKEIFSGDSAHRTRIADGIGKARNDSSFKTAVAKRPDLKADVVKPEILNVNEIRSATNNPDKDSLTGTAIEVPPVFGESQLSESLHDTSVSGNGVLRDSLFAPDWQFYLLMGTLILVAWMRSVFGSVLLKTYEAAVSFTVTLRMYKDNSVLQKQLDNILIGLYFISTGFYLLLLESKFHLFPYGLNGFKRYLFNIGILLLIFYGRSFLMILTGILFNHRALFDEYRYNISVFNKLTGLILLPFILLLNYSQGIVLSAIEWISIALVGSVILLRLYRGFIFSVKKGILILYLFLYLCALEIVPIMVLFKWIQSIV